MHALSRSNRSARKAGSSFERLVADYLAEALGSEGIDRQVKVGTNDLGDVRGVYLGGRPVVVECKEYGGRNELPKWYAEAERERANRDAAYGVVVWKRYRVADPARQHVSMTLATFAAMLAGGPENVIEGGD